MDLQTIERNNERVLTSQQLAEVYETDTEHIKKNFNNNKKRYAEGKHYILLTGDDLKTFKSKVQNLDLAPNVNKLYLWTKKGAFMQAKSLNTDKAWEAYEDLVDDYFVKVEQLENNVRVLSDEETMIASLKLTIETKETVTQLDSRVTTLEKQFEEQITVKSHEQRKIQKTIAIRIYELAEREDYQQLAFDDNDEVTTDLGKVRSKLFPKLHRDLKDAFAVTSYKDITRKDYEEALQYIKSWRPKL